MQREAMTTDDWRRMVVPTIGITVTFLILAPTLGAMNPAAAMMVLAGIVGSGLIYLSLRFRPG